MDFATLTADQFAAMDADDLAMLPLDVSSISTSSSSVSSSSSNSSSSSSSSSSSAADLYPHTLGGDRYLAIAQFYAAAYDAQSGLAQPLYEAVEQVRCLDDVEVTLDLLGSLNTAYMLMENKEEDTSYYLPAVKTLQQHVENTSGLSVVEWIVEVVPGGVVPEGWAALSKLAGFDIDPVIDWAGESSSS